jgi:glyceraldehyde 3-phosphate dehydrogenase
MAVRVGINGFGRTGRALFRAAQRPELDLEIIGINDLGPPQALARLLARDSVFGRFNQSVSTDGDALVVGDRRTRMTAEREVKALPWAELNVDVVVEATGRFTSREEAAGHLDAGAPRVVVSAPSKGADATFVMGVNDDTFDPAHHVVVSNASCTTNCLAVLAKVLDDSFGLDNGFMTTVHAFTADQQLVDGLHKDPRRARAASLNIVPTTTGAARAVGLVLPAIGDRLGGLALRVPVADGSITDLVANLAAEATVAEILEAYREAAGAGPLVGRLEYSEEPLVSSDIVGSPASCIFDAELTMVSGRLVKVLGWYDNECGYANRLAELVAKVGSAPRP